MNVCVWVCVCVCVCVCVFEQLRGFSFLACVYFSVCIIAVDVYNKKYQEHWIVLMVFVSGFVSSDMHY